MKETPRKLDEKSIAEVPKEKQESNLEISDTKKRLFDNLDKMGEVGCELLKKFYDKYIPDSFDEDRLEGDFIFEIEDGELEGLSKIQQEFFRKVVSQIKTDYEELKMDINKLSRKELSRQLHESFNDEKDVIPKASEENFIIVPGGICVAIHNKKYFERRATGDEPLFGFHMRFKNSNNVKQFVKNVFVIYAEDETAKETFEHEYLHLLTENYLEPYEIPLSLPNEIKNVNKAITKIEIEIKKLEEELEYAEFEEVVGIHSSINSLNRKKVMLKDKRDKLVEKTPFFFTEEANIFFRSVRDELSAYAINNILLNDEDTLIAVNYSWKKRVEQLQYAPDRKKLKKQWRELQNIIYKCSQLGVDADKLLPIFITSQNFDQMTKRISLFLENY